eukprot:1338335-Rhodomonas_salina.2
MRISQRRAGAAAARRARAHALQHPRERYGHARRNDSLRGELHAEMELLRAELLEMGVPLSTELPSSSTRTPRALSLFICQQLPPPARILAEMECE